MKKFSFFLSIILLLETLLVFASSPPAEFGNASTTTCYLGGDAGYLNCTGDIKTSAGNFYGVEYLFTNKTNIKDYFGGIDTWGPDDYVNESGDTMTGNLTMSSAGILSDKYYNSTGHLEWIKPEHIFDVDKEDIEGDLNTFVDIAGDNMTGTYYSQDVVPKTNNTYSFGKEFLRFLIGWVSTLKTDYLKSSINITSKEYYYDNETNIKDYFGGIDTNTWADWRNSSMYDYLSPLMPRNWDNGTFVEADSWISIDDYPSNCNAGNYVTGLADTLTCTADPMDTAAEWATLCTNCVDNTDLGSDSVDLTSDALSSAYAGDGLTGGSTVALAVNPGDGIAISADAVIFDCSDVTGSATDGIACSGEDLTVAGGTCLTATTTGLGVTANCIEAAQLLYDTNQHLNTTSSVTFEHLQINGKLNSDDTVYIDDDLNVSGNVTLNEYLLPDTDETGSIGSDLLRFFKGWFIDLRVDGKITSDDTVYIDDALNISEELNTTSNIFINSNTSKIYLGDQQSAEIYFNGTGLLLKVT